MPSGLSLLTNSATEVSACGPGEDRVMGQSPASHRLGPDSIADDAHFELDVLSGHREFATEVSLLLALFWHRLQQDMLLSV
jgi:hypothetical protein